MRIERSGADLWPHAADFTADFTADSALGKICGTHARARMGPPRGPPMRRTALALFVVEPTQLRWGKLDLVQAKSKFRLEARVGGFSVGIAASCIACEFELLDGSISYPNFCAAKDAACCF